MRKRLRLLRKRYGSIDREFRSKFRTLPKPIYRAYSMATERHYRQIKQRELRKTKLRSVVFRGKIKCLSNYFSKNIWANSFYS